MRRSARESWRGVHRAAAALGALAVEAESAQPTSLDPAEFGAFIRKEIERWSKVIRAANIQSS